MRILEENNDDDLHTGINDKKYLFKISGSNNYATLISPFLPFHALSRKNFWYGKLPLQPIKLHVLKLDGSSFEISVAKNPTLAQLKQAVEDAFTHLPKHGIGKVSWSHVWAQFCLSFEGQKLLHEQDNASLLGLKDGDQLQFVRHASTSYNFVKERSTMCDYDLEEYKASPSRRMGNHSSEVQDNSKQQHEDEYEEGSCDEIAVNITCQSSWAHLFRRLFSYRRQKRHDTSYAELG